jgi:hypothetical protein
MGSGTEAGGRKVGLSCTLLEWLVVSGHYGAQLSWQTGDPKQDRIEKPVRQDSECPSCPIIIEYHII